MRLRGGCVKTPPCVAAAVVCGAKRGAEIGVGIVFVVSETERWLVVVAPRVGVGRGGRFGVDERRRRPTGGRQRGSKSICTRARKRSDARAKNSRADVPPVARAPAKGKASNSVTGIPVKRTSSSVWRGPCGTECRWARPSRKSPSGGAKEFPLLATPRLEWSAPSHRSRSPAAPDPLGPSRNSRPRKSHSRHRDPTYRCFRATRRAGWRPPRARTRPPTTERAYFALPSDCWSETDRNPPRAAPARTPSGSVLPPPLPTVAHHHSCFSLSFVPLAACRPGRARELSAHAGDGGWVREILTRKPFESPDVANLRRASSGRSPLRCGKVSLRAMRRGTLPATSVGIAAF